MTLTRKNMILTFLQNKILLLFFVATLLVPQFLLAQGGLSLSVSPTLFEMSAEPGRTWNSAIRVININSFDLELEATVVNFVPRGEDGTATYLPLLDEEQANDSLAAWIDIGSKTTFSVPAEQTVSLPLTIRVPENAPPGGHYAAVLIGTKSISTPSGQSAVETSQVVSSLMFLRVAGEIDESAKIRSFRPTKALLDTPEVEFELRVQNSGNVHIQPRGDIRIYNMWGQERGVIPVNRKSLFGNVLPNSVRKYVFGWTGEWSVSDIGRYRVEAFLSYGENGRQSLSAETHFWVVPWKPLLFILGGLLLFFWLLSWAVRAYIRRMLALSGVVLQSSEKSRTRVDSVRRVNLTKAKRRLSFTAPLQVGLLDLRGHLSRAQSLRDRVYTLAKLSYEYRQPLTGVLLLLAGLGIMIWFVSNATTDERDYSVTIGDSADGVTLTASELAAEYSANPNVVSNGVSLVVVNRSGINGLETKEAQALESAGYTVTDVRTDEVAVDTKTIIVYDPALATEALALSEFFGGALLSAYSGIPATEERIVVYLGTDQQ